MHNLIDKYNQLNLGGKMSKFYALGSYTDQALGGFLKNPNEDRSEVIKTLFGSVGGLSLIHI